MLHFKKKSRLFVAITFALVFALALVGCGDQKTGNNDKDEFATFRIGTQGYAEVETLAEIVKTIIEEKTPHKVEHIKNLGSVLAGHEATLQDNLDMYTSFTGTAFLGLFEQTLTQENRDPEKVYQYVAEHYLEEFDLYAVPPYGYDNTYAIAVPRKWAENNNVTKISDLTSHASKMTLAVDQTWKDYPGQGYKEFTELYGFEFKETPQMDFGLMYRSIEMGDVDAICAYSTDGQLAAQDLLVLEDDLQFNPPYNGILVLHNEIREEYPQVKEALSLLKGLITTKEMQSLNKEVAVDQKDSAEVAKRFLEEKGIL